MKAADFLREFDESHFPAERGPWIGIDQHDPPFTMTELRRMERQGVIEIRDTKGSYRLTLKATRLRPADTGVSGWSDEV